MKNAMFTICAKNFYGFALTLYESIKKHHPDVSFYVFIADDAEKDAFGSKAGEKMEVLSASSVIGLPQDEWTDLSFRYDIVELCTSIKPLCFRYLFEQGFESAIYFDPDILVFDRLDDIYSELKTHDAIVTPHELDINSDNPMRGGIFNLGFLALKSSPVTLRLLSWWWARLKDFCFSDPIRGYFTDQKWMDFLTVVLPEGSLCVSRHPGMNYAPWNFDERLVSCDEKGKYNVSFRDQSINANSFPLVFFHFSAFKYTKLIEKSYIHKTVDMEGREPVLYELLSLYGEQLNASCFKKYLEMAYTYDRYSDGRKIALSHRRIYSRLIEEGVSLGNPFDACGSFYQMLKKAHFWEGDDENAERIGVSKINGFERKVRVIDSLSRFMIRVIGYGRFSLLARFMIRYLSLNNRARLLSQDTLKYKIKSF